MKKNTTCFLTVEEARKKQQWIHLDASGKTLGRLATEAAKILRGKHKTCFTPNIDTGDGLIIINAEKVKVTGAKEAQKIYRYYTGAVGGLKEVPYRRMMERKPDFILRHAISKMMPKTRLGKAQLKRLRIFKGEEHNMQAQQPLHAQI
ncbi:MAG: 50S ribosomal protein L13 [Simkaniaceae bacterium]